MTQHSTDILLVTVTKVESKAVLDVFVEATKEKAQPFEIDGRHYFSSERLMVHLSS
jgi:hypothetical protein